jgi:uncharacterized protein YggE
MGGLVLGLGAVGFVLSPFNATKVGPPGTVQVEGQATINIAPNQATISLGDLTQAKSASTAMSESAVLTQRIIAAVERSGVQAVDIQTSGLNLNPVYGSASGNEAPPITGYQVSDTITVSLDAVKSVGSVIDAATSAGANQINGVTFGVINPQNWYAVAYQDAMRDARQQADAVIAPEKLRIVGIQSISAQNGSAGVTVTAFQNNAAVLPSQPIMPGQTQLNASVTVVYKVASS